MNTEHFSSRLHDRYGHAPAYDRGTLPVLNSFGHTGGTGNGRSRSPTRVGGTRPALNERPPPLFPSSGPTGKRGSRACVSCRKGKNRCEFDPAGANQSCRRCLINGTACVFEKASDKRDSRHRAGTQVGEGWTNDAEGRVAVLERSVKELAHGQTQIQHTLEQILANLPSNGLSSTPKSVPSSVLTSNGGTSTTPIAGVFPPQTALSVLPDTPLRDHSFSASVETGFAADSDHRQSTAANKNRDSQQSWPKLPGFAPPNHRFGIYGIVPVSTAPPSPSHSPRSSRASSIDSESSDAAVPSASMGAPIQALQTLANAADQAAALVNGDGDLSASERSDVSRASGNEAGLRTESDQRPNRKRRRETDPGRNIHLRVRKQTKPDPTPRNPFPDVVTKGLVSDSEARELWNIFFSGCHYFVPLFDKQYDIYESFLERTPFSSNGLFAVAAKIRAGNSPVGSTFQRCLEEGQGIARSTLFGPIVRKEAVMAMLILSVWSQYGWLPVGHALRMGLDMNLHRALDELANTEKNRSEVEERDLVVSSRIWLNCYLHENLSSLGTGKPLTLRNDSSVRGARILLSHPMRSETDASLVARVELVNLRIKALEQLTPLHGKVNSKTISSVCNIFDELQSWHEEWRDIHTASYANDSAVLIHLLDVELGYAQLWTVCVALRGCQWDKLRPEQRGLAFEAKDAALRCVETYLRVPLFRQHLKYATHDQLAAVAFAAVFLLKIAMLYPDAIPLPTLFSQVSEIAHVLSAECFAERYALTLKLMLANLRRKTGVVTTAPGTPRGGDDGPEISTNNVNSGDSGDGSNADGGLQSLLSFPPAGSMGDGMAEETWPYSSDVVDGFAWPTEFSPSNLPTWLQENSIADLGLPVDGSDSLFLPMELANMFLPSTLSHQFALPPLPDSEDCGAEAW